MAGQRGVSRRKLLRMTAEGAVGLVGLNLLTACGPGPAAPTATPGSPTPAPAEPTKASPTAPAKASPTAPARATATGAPTPQPASPTASPKPSAAKMGSTLIGKLEGPEIITDAAKFPKSFKESPELAELVKAGKLPPVAERVGSEPLVVKPLHEIGKYGGELRRGFSGPADEWNGQRVVGSDTLLWYDYTGEKLVPNLAKSWELAPDEKSLTIFLRKGVKWSDGQPFTADDIMFFFDDIWNNKELTPTQNIVWFVDGKPIKVEKVDDYTVKFSFPGPYSFFLSLLAGSNAPLGGPARLGALLGGGYAPAHYLKQFHKKYVSEDELNKRAKAERFDNWIKLLAFKFSWQLNPELPVLTAWKTVSPINKPTWILERNPYFWVVDTEGNQLPYIDRIVMTLGENLEVINLRAIAGEYDMQERHIDLGKLPVFLENQEKIGYKVYLDPGAYGADAALHFNLAYDKDPEIAKWFNTTDFRRALSLGVERDQLNETFWLGTGVPGSIVPDESTKYNPGPEYRTLWHVYDPKKANEMLDKLGLDKKDSEGYRLRSDGKGRLTIEVTTYGGQFLQFTQIAEMIREQFKKIGIDLNVKEIERSLGINKNLANELQILMWTNDDTVPELLASNKVIPTRVDSFTFHGNPIGKWFQTGGKEGTAPKNPRMKEALEKFQKAYTASEQERIKLCKEIYAIAVDEVFSIGTVGLSPASQGVRVVKTKLGNVPARIVNNVSQRHPGLARPYTFFWKS